MKKLISCLLVVLLCISLAGCTQSAGVDPSTSTQTDAQQAQDTAQEQTDTDTAEDADDPAALPLAGVRILQLCNTRGDGGPARQRSRRCSAPERRIWRRDQAGGNGEFVGGSHQISPHTARRL